MALGVALAVGAAVVGVCGAVVAISRGGAQRSESRRRRPGDASASWAGDAGFIHASSDDDRNDGADTGGSGNDAGGGGDGGGDGGGGGGD